uniref:Uncharacterized protein n=1 Tax=Lotharella oceanica TaxID=641309 RepID=A0A7S2TH23_9EUKA
MTNTSRGVLRNRGNTSPLTSSNYANTWYPVLGDAHTFQTTLAPLSAATAPDSQIDGVLHMLLHLHYILGQTVRNGKELILFGVLSPSSVDRF